MRILIANQLKAEHPLPIAMSGGYNVPLPLRHTINDLRDNLSYTRNIGNLVHLQAPASLFKSTYTVAGSLKHIHDAFPTPWHFSRFISKHFDAVIFCFANGLRSGNELGGPDYLKILKRIRSDVAIYGFGLGLQGKLDVVDVE